MYSNSIIRDIIKDDGKNLARNISQYRSERRNLWNRRNMLGDNIPCQRIIPRITPPIPECIKCDCPERHIVCKPDSPGYRKRIDLKYVAKENGRLVDKFEVSEAKCEMPRGLKEKVCAISDCKNQFQEVVIDKEMNGKGLVEEKRTDLITGHIDKYQQFKNMHPCDKEKFLKEWNYKVLQNKCQLPAVESSLCLKSPKSLCDRCEAILCDMLQQ